jgi:Rnl2 family RNA ligase
MLQGDTMSFHKYPSIVLVRDRQDIFAVKEVVATEKLHGSNFRIHFPCGMTSLAEVQYGSHDVEKTPGVPFPLGIAVNYFEARPQLLQAMLDVIKSYGFSEATVYGEAYGPGIKAKGIKYSNGQEMLFRAFDIMIGDNFLTYDLFVEVTDKMGLARTHLVYKGPPSLEAFDALLEKPSTEGKLNGITDDANVAEGVVIRSNPLFRDVFGEWLICKHKAAKFSEESKQRPPKGPRVVSPADEFAMTYVTMGRVRNAVGRLQDRGVALTLTMKDMPTLLDEMLFDLDKECRGVWAEIAPGQPFQEALNKGTISRVLGPIYRAYLEEAV